MTRTIGRRLALAGAALATPMLSLRNQAARAQAAPIRIGFLNALAGAFGTEAQDQIWAAQLAILLFNEKDGLNGRTAELLVRDDRRDPGEAAARTTELIEKDRVDFIVGGRSEAVQLAINEVTRQRRVLFNGLGQSDAINEAANFRRYTFHEALNPHMTAGAVARYAFPKFGKRVALLAADDAYGQEMARGFTDAGKPLGIEVVADVRHPVGTTDFSGLLPDIQASKPEVLCVCNVGRDQQLAVEQAAELGLKRSTRLVAPVLSYSARVGGGAAAFAGVVGGTSYYWKLENTVPSARAFNDGFRKMHDGRIPSDSGALGFAGITTVLAAVRAAGTADTEKVVDALAGLKYDAGKGPQYYRGCDHQSVQSVLIIQSKDSAGAGDADVFDIVGGEGPDERFLRSCADLGHG